jgi:type II secretory pathway component PulM
MLAGITKLVGYTKAPKATYMMLHPIRGVRQWRASRQPRNRATLAGAGAAVLALPVGLWLALRKR